MEGSTLKRIIFIIGAVLAVFLLVKMLDVLDTATPDKIVIVTEESVKLLDQPNEGSYALLDLQSGDKLEVLEEGSEWFKVTNGQFTGYVKSSQIKRSVLYKEDKQK